MEFVLDKHNDGIRGRVLVHFNSEEEHQINIS